MHPSRKTYSNSFRLLLRASVIIFISVFFVRFIVYVLGATYDWDIDHEMYFGSRLLGGELMYTKELNDKLPFAQFLFAIPAELGSVSYWFILSAIFAIIASTTMFAAVKQIIIEGWPLSSKSLAIEIALFSCTFYLFLISVMPGSITVISSMAASMALIAISLQLIYCGGLETKNNRVLTFIISAIFAALSISLRPYLAPAIVLIGIWIPARGIASSKANQLNLGCITQIASEPSTNAKLILKYAITWTISLIIFGAIINVTPYIITNDLNQFTKGLLLGSQRLNPQSTLTNVTSQINSLIELGNGAFMLTSIALIFPFFVAIKRIFAFKSIKFLNNLILLVEIDLLFSGLIPVFLIETAILGRHFWPHYQQLFAPFIALSLAMSIAYLANSKLIEVNFNMSAFKTSLILIVFLILFMRFEIAKSVRNVGRHPQASDSEYVKIFIENRKKKGLPSDFLHVNSMYLHWKLRESRHGFPTASHIEHINWGWWADLDKQTTDNLYTSSVELCKAFQEHGPTIIFIDRSSLSYKCLTSSDSIYYNFEISSKIPIKDAILIRK